jgi:hypothetical protein
MAIAVSQECKATSGKIPMSGSVGPKVGLGYLVIGDAAAIVRLAPNA